MIGGKRRCEFFAVRTSSTTARPPWRTLTLAPKLHFSRQLLPNVFSIMRNENGGNIYGARVVELVHQFIRRVFRPSAEIVQANGNKSSNQFCEGEIRYAQRK